MVPEAGPGDGGSEFKYFPLIEIYININSTDVYKPQMDFS